MKEVKTPKKPLAYYYGIVLIVLIVFNLVVTPILMEHQVKETDYGTFMSMIEKKNIGEVEVEDNQIIFTDKDQKNIYNILKSVNINEIDDLEIEKLFDLLIVSSVSKKFNLKDTSSLESKKFVVKPFFLTLLS